MEFIISVEAGAKIPETEVSGEIRRVKGVNPLFSPSAA
jgi:hypothetical protein